MNKLSVCQRDTFEASRTTRASRWPSSASLQLEQATETIKKLRADKAKLKAALSDSLRKRELLLSQATLQSSCSLELQSACNALLETAQARPAVFEVFKQHFEFPLRLQGHCLLMQTLRFATELASLVPQTLDSREKRLTSLQKEMQESIFRSRKLLAKTSRQQSLNWKLDVAEQLLSIKDDCENESFLPEGLSVNKSPQKTRHLSEFRPTKLFE